MHRHHPSPLPAIHPLPEYLADGQRKQWYEEMKAALQVPWMGIVRMAYAHYPSFSGTLWDALKPLAVSGPFVEQAQQLRELVELQVVRRQPASLGPRLREIGYAERELDQIRAIIDVFSQGNYPYLLIATLVRRRSCRLRGCFCGCCPGW